MGEREEIIPRDQWGIGALLPMKEVYWSTTPRGVGPAKK